MGETIVVGYDGHELSKRALDRAISEAKGLQGRVLIVAVEEMPLDPYAPPTFSIGQPMPSPMVEPPQLKPLTDEAMGRAEAAGVRADFVWAAGDPARTILDAARDNNAEAIVIGLHHHSLFKRLLGEDVDAEVEKEAKCKVITVE